jgi:hypothetical protein
MTNPDDREPEDHLEADERDPEASPEDVSEQVAPAIPAEEEEDEPVRVRNEVNEWDAVEQARIVDLDEDYR